MKNTQLPLHAALLLILATLFMSAAPAQTDSEPSADILKIVFSQDIGFQNLARITTLDGRIIRFLPLNEGYNHAPTCSPDGRYIAVLSEVGLQIATSSFEVIYTIPPTDLGGINVLGGISLSANASKVAFAKAGENRHVDIYVSNPDGSGLVRLTNDPAWDSWPALSPDGSKVVFSSDYGVPKNNSELYIVNTDGTQRTQLTFAGKTNRHPRWSPDGTKIAFTSSRGESGGLNIYVMNADGTDVTALTNTADANYQPAWSPDGSEIVFVSNRNPAEDMQIYVMAADGSHVRRVNHDGQFSDEPCWLLVPRPTNGPIVYVSKADGDWEIMRVNADGSNVQQLTHNAVQDWAPAWSPDGTKIAFMSKRSDPNGDLWLMDADGGNLVQLTSGSAADNQPSWSPDGQTLAFTSNRDGSTEIYLMGLEPDAPVTRVTLNNSIESSPVWSPVGFKLAFDSDADGQWDIYTVSSSSHSGQDTPQRLTNHPSLDRYPAWSPDGLHLAFVSDRSGYDVYVMPVTGGTAANLTNHSAYDSYPAWSPDGLHMAFTSNRDGDHEVWTMTTAGSSPAQMTFNTAIEWDPDWTALTFQSQMFLTGPARPLIEAAVLIVPPQLPVLQPGTYSPDAAGLYYTGVWHSAPARSDSHYTDDPDGWVEFAFTGSGVIVHLARRPDSLAVEACVDTQCQIVDLYSPTIEANYALRFADFKPGEHRFSISNLVGSYVYFDGVQIEK